MSHEEGLKHIADRIDNLILQHVNYLNRLEEACQKRVKFTHLKPNETEFGKILLSEIIPYQNTFPPEIQEVLKEIERDHQAFHELADKIDSENPIQDHLDATSECKMILELYKLEKLVKKLP